MCVTDPLKIVLTNYPEGEVEEVDAVNNPEDESMGKRKVPFSRRFTSNGKILWKNPPPDSTVLLPGKRSVYAMPIISNAMR